MLVLLSPVNVSAALADEYVLYSGPVMLMNKDARMVGQAVILPEIANTHNEPAD